MELITLAQVNSQIQNQFQQPFTITKEIFAALSPLDQIAATALEKCGLVRIVDEIEEVSVR
jgi:hypothetical protein